MRGVYLGEGVAVVTGNGSSPHARGLLIEQLFLFTP